MASVTAESAASEKLAPSMGLALSGGGFRAAFFHLGVVRFLRDANLLSRVTCCSSVSGGSVFAAHLVLNWHRYSGSEAEFEEAARELVDFVKLDVRNRIVRRFPLASTWNFFRQVGHLGASRRNTRAGMLEWYYQQHLFGEVPLFELPDTPKLYILATDLSEGSLCAFSREGLLLQRRSKTGQSLGVEEIEMGLATVPMAVAASSAFPGFFPPLVLNGTDVGASTGEFTRQAFTDGGVFDNLGLRFFRHYQEIADERLPRVLVSDAGAPFRVHAGGSSGGLLKTALRSSDILMTRVNELELESIAEIPEALWIPITRQVLRRDDPSALHPEIQWQAATIRTDLDSFSDLEIAALVQHGYAVARQVCRENDLAAVPQEPQPIWHPFQRSEPGKENVGEQLHDPSMTLAIAKQLQKSGSRRTLSTLLSWRDWPSYLWVSALLLIALTFPYLFLKARRTAIRQGYVLSAVAQTSPVYRDVLQILESNSRSPVGRLQAESVEQIEPLDFTGYQVVTDDRIYDLRGWKRASDPSPPLMHARFRFRRTVEAADQPILRIHLPSSSPTMHAEYYPKSLHPQSFVQKRRDDSFLFETQLDFTSVPIDADTEIVVRQLMPSNMAYQQREFGSFRFTIAAETKIARIWVLLPENRDHTQFRLSRFPIDDPSHAELVEATTTVSLPIGAIANFEIIDPEDGFRYECRWEWTTD